jgi:hypothetical protein
VLVLVFSTTLKLVVPEISGADAGADPDPDPDPIIIVLKNIS